MEFSQQILCRSRRRKTYSAVRGAIFDMDGTLLDSMPMWDQVGKIYLAGLGVQAKPGLEKVMFPMTIQESAAYIRREYALPLTEEEIVAGLNHTLEEYYAHDAPLKSGVEEFLEGLRVRGIAMSVATVTDKPYAEAALRRLGVRPYFRSVMTATEVGAGKYRPDLYLKTAEGLGTSPGETLVFEDALYASRTAKAAGFVTVGIYDASSADVQSALRAACTYYLSDFGDFPAFAAEALN